MVPLQLIWLRTSSVALFRLLFDRQESLQPQAGTCILFTLCDKLTRYVALLGQGSVFHSHFTRECDLVHSFANSNVFSFT